MMKLKSLFVVLTLLISANTLASETCVASFYGVGDGFQGKKTASGVRFDTHKLMAAHRTLKFGSKVLVKNLSNGKSTHVVILDRGPFAQKTKRCIDLSYAAKNAIGMGGTAPVSIQVIK